jgi:hypothetical protein
MAAIMNRFMIAEGFKWSNWLRRRPDPPQASWTFNPDPETSSEVVALPPYGHIIEPLNKAAGSRW